MLKGTGIWIAFHDAALAQSGNTWSNLLDRLVDHGINVVFPRAGGSTSHGITRENDWNSVTAHKVIQIAKAKGVQVVPWYYSLPSNWKQEVDFAKGLLDDGADGVCIDGEIEWETDKSGDHHEAAFEYGETLRREVGDGALICHAPMPYINWHLTYPWDQFASFCDMVMPQFYWTGNSWGQMMRGAVPQWSQLWASNSPRAHGFAPIGCTYGNDGAYKQGTVIPFQLDDLAAFDRTFKDCDFRSYYSLEASNHILWDYLKPKLTTPLGQQIALWKLGFYSDKLDGIFGLHSRVATQAFQAQHSIVVDGTFDQATIDAMASVIGPHSM